MPWNWEGRAERWFEGHLFALMIGCVILLAACVGALVFLAMSR